MSSVLPDAPLPPNYAAAGGGGGGGAGGFAGVRSHGTMHRAPQNRGVNRTTECPCAVRLYHLTSSDVAVCSEFCSIVLGAPSVGIREAVRSGAVANPTHPPSSPAPSSSSSSAAVVPPIAVQLAWADTTIWEVAHTALQAVRAAVDDAYAAERRRRAGARHNSSSSSAAPEADGAAAAAEEDEAAEAPFTTRPHCYELELLTGSVNAMGQASTIPLGVVACRQVMPGHPALLPMRRKELDYNTALYELPYNLGDPVFVTCKRII